MYPTWPGPLLFVCLGALGIGGAVGMLMFIVHPPLTYLAGVAGFLSVLISGVTAGSGGRKSRDGKRSKGHDQQEPREP